MDEDIQSYSDDSTLTPRKDCTTSSDVPEHFSFSKFVSFHDFFVDEKPFLNELRLELDSLDLCRPNSSKIESLWLNPSELCYNSTYPNILKLLGMVNNHGSMKVRDLNCCNIICYSNDKKTLRLHSDNESDISQTHPIATFSLGASRLIEFVPIGSHHTRVVHSVEATNNSLYVMHPGCQSILKHRVL